MFKLCFATTLLFLTVGFAHAAEGPRALSANFAAMDPPWDVPDLLFKDSAGQDHLLRTFLKQELKGQYVLLNIWASWCTPCSREMPSLDQLQAIMGSRKLAVVAVSVDREGDVTVPAFYRRYGLSHLKFYWDRPGTSLRRLHLRGIPTTLLIDPDGKEIGRVRSHIDWMREDNLAFLNRLLDGAKRP